MLRKISVDMIVENGEYIVVLTADGIDPRRFRYGSEEAARKALRQGLDNAVKEEAVVGVDISSKGSAFLRGARAEDV